MTNMMDFIDQELDEIKGRGEYRSLRRVEGHQGPRVTVDGRECVNLCSNNYLGLANHPRLKKAAIDAIQKYGAGTGASRLVCGNLRLHQELEAKIAGFKGQEAALIFNSGYVANLGIITALVGRGDIIFSDKLNHASIVDAMVLSRAEFVRYAHKDMESLEKSLREAREYKEKLIITDTLFSMDGDIAPLPEIADLAKKYNAMVMVDEAHATGAFGETLGGLVEHFGLKEDIDIQMGTLSKALGCFGGYVSGRSKLMEYLINKSRPFIYTTSLPPSVLASCIEAIDIIGKERWLKDTLMSNALLVRKGLIDLGFDIMNSESQIIPVLIGESEKAAEFSRLLLAEGIFMQAIRPPTVPKGQARLRLTVMATHKKEDLNTALAAIEKVGKKIGAIS